MFAFLASLFAVLQIWAFSRALPCAWWFAAAEIAAFTIWMAQHFASRWGMAPFLICKTFIVAGQLRPWPGSYPMLKYLAVFVLGGVAWELARPRVLAFAAALQAKAAALKAKFKDAVSRL